MQTLLSGLWLLFLARRLSQPASFRPSRTIRYASTALLGIFWLASLAFLAGGWQPGTYLGLILVWALPPVLVQLFFGADILWQQRKLAGLVLATTTLYLAAADFLATGSGTWTIDPQQSTGLLIGRVGWRTEANNA